MIPINLDHSHQNLSTLEGFEGISEAPNEIRGLNCNFNHFQTFKSFPTEMIELETLRMSHNQYTVIGGVSSLSPVIRTFSFGS